MAKIKKNPPGKRWFKKLSNHTKWLIYSISGLILVGCGICVISEAGQLKHTENDSSRWILMGTYGLVIFNAGLSFFGQGVIFKSKIEAKKMFKKILTKENGKQTNRTTSRVLLKPTKMKNPED